VVVVVVVVVVVIKVKFAPEQAMKAQKRGSSSTLSLTSALWGWVVNDTPQSLYPRQRDPVVVV
jgi:hypothetical protein